IKQELRNHLNLDICNEPNNNMILTLLIVDTNAEVRSVFKSQSLIDCSCYHSPLPFVKGNLDGEAIKM
ncbi:MAG: hypothetical protein ACTHKJ_00910, partial [Candidatus Nitrosocosmicus sp.]